MDKNEETERVGELEDMLKLADIIEKEKAERGIGISLIGSMKLGFGLAFGFWLFHVILLMFLLVLLLVTGYIEDISNLL